MKRSLLILFILLIPFMVMAQTAGGAIKRPGKSHSISKVAPKSQIESSTNKKGPTSHQNKSKALTGYTNGHAWVDLGLPSGTLWATMNVGASKPEEYGDYFAWGEIKSKANYNWETYKWCKGSYHSMTKYCTQSNYGYNGFTDNKTELDPVDDAASVNWGKAWCIPNYEQYQELFRYSTIEWTTVNGLNGRKITSRTNGNSILLPAAGYRCDASLNNAGSVGYYWSRTLGSDTGLYPRSWSLIIDDIDEGLWHQVLFDGQSVRPVTKRKSD